MTIRLVKWIMVIQMITKINFYNKQLLINKVKIVKHKTMKNLNKKNLTNKITIKNNKGIKCRIFNRIIKKNKLIFRNKNLKLKKKIDKEK